MLHERRNGNLGERKQLKVKVIMLSKEGWRKNHAEREMGNVECASKNERQKTWVGSQRKSREIRAWDGDRQATR
jgi:hypothetical protein